MIKTMVRKPTFPRTHKRHKRTYIRGGYYDCKEDAIEAIRNLRKTGNYRGFADRDSRGWFIWVSPVDHFKELRYSERIIRNNIPYVFVKVYKPEEYGELLKDKLEVKKQGFRTAITKSKYGFLKLYRSEKKSSEYRRRSRNG